MHGRSEVASPREHKKVLSERKIKKTEWTGRELNPRPLPCQGSDLPLIYRPRSNIVVRHWLKELGFLFASSRVTFKVWKEERQRYPLRNLKKIFMEPTWPRQT
jgi:hypothetical protein